MLLRRLVDLLKGYADPRMWLQIYRLDGPEYFTIECCV